MDAPRVVVKPGEGRSVWLGGMGVVFKVSGADTGGAFAVVEHPIEPGRLVLPHVHLHEDEYSYVLACHYPTVCTVTCSESKSYTISGSSELASTCVRKT
jgi:hypothetical protein